MIRRHHLSALGLVGLLLAGAVTEAHARDEALVAEYQAAFPELFASPRSGGAQPMALPDIFGPGAVLNVGNVHMKVTNFGLVGNPFLNLSSDPSAQWPAASGIEYMNFILLSVGAVNKTTTDPAAVRRVSIQAEWRPQTLDPEDRMYRSYDGQVGGMRNSDDDNDSPKAADPLLAYLSVDEDFQDGRDNDGDGKIDEDFAAIGQQMWSCVMWDNTLQALQTTFSEKHVPINLECRQTAFAYSVPGFQDFNVVNWTIFNRSGHPLDSMYVGIRWDIDAGPLDQPTFFNDDIDIPFFPFGDFTVVLDPGNKWGEKLDPKGNRRQRNHAPMPEVPADSALCPRVKVRVNGFSVVDDDGDVGRTTGIPSILLLGHTIDPLGRMAPSKVGWRGFRSFVAGTPYSSGGNPVTDAQRYEMFERGEGIDPETGFISAGAVDQPGDIQGWAVIGPFGNTVDGQRYPIPDGGSIEVTFALAIKQGDLVTVNQYPADYQRYLDGRLTAADLFAKYPALENAFAAQLAYEGVYDDPPTELTDDQNTNVPDFHGRETRRRAPEGFILSDADCRGVSQQIDQFHYTWFDYDCDFCTGVWAFGSGPGGGTGKFLRRWNTAAPPPNPNLNVASAYNYTDNTDRVVAPAGSNMITLAWDNLSEVTVDPEKGHFDFRSYRVWKAADWRRPVGSAGPADDDWALLAHFRFFDYADSNKERFSPGVMQARGFFAPAADSVRAGRAVCPQVYIPNLSLQTIVLSKSRFATAGEAADWVETRQDQLRQAVGYDLNLRTRDLSQDAVSWRFRQADGECKVGSFHTVELEDSTVLAEVCLNALAERRGFRVPICLYHGDLWDPQLGYVLRPMPDRCPQRAADGRCLVDTLACVPAEGGGCRTEEGKVLGTENTFITRTVYPVGRYRFVDREVRNGFVYFYSVAAGDSSSAGTIDTRDDELVSRRAAVEAEGVVPQEATRDRREVWVVPNPYRGVADIGQRPSAWDLVPSAADPTGTHVDFLGLPAGPWTIRIYTVSGDLVQVLRHTDPVNDSVRGGVAGANRQQDTPNDGQARWNLITRNGQDVVSGVYLFVVESNLGSQRGKFVVIR